ncbi:GTP-binding protein [Haloferax mediterranei ATCC 33500]|uniref:GTP-binding protein n=1 Tax=Haloferax mediterranei (strain ATCC 33500 / DSM 1411 / JCM 8866 / NBRC 14739 / NCIMB 2177 / R-4) TaxID=523841 RepID=I3R650_HALMT|nr:GTPase [Haloferax mediterranei]AFK19710.1 GTP-binding protein [Haloferax mediterranei ATCC 33500]AHZ23098.1 GTP-binding protein [Haloferax mediterranei ATCC 33500]EMA00032.1 GTP-binding protein [Haloferax mediterranei ATCC 33500]MDX5987545.1 GTPase [Haloferax mediterranei ATCC 33500]QCQ74042.1 GTP-binding protein [Haloferax mediterranei ATCC 33500]
MIFESLPTTPRSDELIDKAFSRAARTGRAKQNKLEAQQSMLQTASNILSDNLENVVVEWPDFETVDPFYYELADAIVDVDEVRKSLSEIMWASRQIDEIAREYQPKLRKTDADLARKHRKQAFARMANITEEVEDDLLRIGEARDALKNLPDIRPDEPAIVVAGYPNVGKSSFVNDVTRASNEIARYPFTTKGVQIGHFDRERIRYQIIDTPGLLDRPEDERNDIEKQAVSALEHLADAVIFVADASAECGYPIESQLELRDAVQARFEERDIPVLTVCNKSDRSTDMEADLYMSVETGENVDAVLDAAADAIGFEPDIPPSRNE